MSMLFLKNTYINFILKIEKLYKARNIYPCFRGAKGGGAPPAVVDAPISTPPPPPVPESPHSCRHKRTKRQLDIIDNRIEKVLQQTSLQ